LHFTKILEKVQNLDENKDALLLPKRAFVLQMLSLFRLESVYSENYRKIFINGFCKKLNYQGNLDL
jgi:hypothetical protein